MRTATVAFGLTLFVMFVPYELVVRASERRFGMTQADALVQTSRKIEGFTLRVRAGERFDALLIGSSEVELGLRPDILAPVTGRTYNFGMGAVSAIPVLEMIERLRFRPRTILIGVDPIDVTTSGVMRGTKLIDQGTAARASSQLSDWARAATYSLVHGASPNRKRSLGQWVDLLRDGGRALQFLNNGIATGSSREMWIDGYIGMDRSMSRSEIDVPGVGYVNEYAAARAVLLPRFTRAIQRLRAAGIDVVVVRLPTTRALRLSLARQSTFEDDIRSLAAAGGADFVDGFTLVDEAFTTDPDNFVDANHLNARGSTAFSRALAAALARRAARRP